MSEAADRVKRIQELAAALFDKAESLGRLQVGDEHSAVMEHLDVKSGINFSNEVRLFEMRLLRRALEVTGGNKARAARILRLSTSTLWVKVKNYGLS